MKRELPGKRHATKTLELESGWIIDAYVDEDHHLNVFIRNKDGTEVFDNSEDNAAENEVGFRFTSKKIEDEYKEVENNA